MLQRSLLRNSLSLSPNNGACIFCQAANLHSTAVRRKQTSYWKKAPITRRKLDLETTTYSVDPDEAIKQQLRPRKKTVAINQTKQIVEPKIKRIGSSVLLSAHNAGFLKLPALHAQKIIDQFRREKSAVDSDTLKNMCNGLGVQLDDVTNLARIFIRSKNASDRQLGGSLLLRLSKAGSAVATVHAVKMAYKQKQLHAQEIQQPLQRLKELLAQGTYAPAMVLQGLIYESIGRPAMATGMYEKAIKVGEMEDSGSAVSKKHVSSFLKRLFGKEESNWSEKAISNPDAAAAAEADMELDIAAAYLQLGGLLLDKNVDRAKKCFEAAAMKYDDPNAYFYLAEFEGGEYTWNWLQYTVKAAASGHTDSAYNLGVFYSLPRDNIRRIKDKRVQEEVLNNVLFRPTLWDRFLWATCRHYNLSHYLTFVQQNVISTIEVPFEDIYRLEWARRWHELAWGRMHYGSGIQHAKILWSLGYHSLAVDEVLKIREAKLDDIEKRWRRAREEVERLYIGWTGTKEFKSLLQWTAST